MSFPLLTAPVTDVRREPPRPDPASRMTRQGEPAEAAYDVVHGKAPFDQQFFVEWEVAEAS